MDQITPYVIAVITAVSTLLVRWVATKISHTGNVRSSDADTVFKASESIRNDLAKELAETRRERDHYADRLEKCLEDKSGE